MGVSFADKLKGIDTVIYRILVREIETDDVLEDHVIARIRGFRGQERMFALEEELACISYAPCDKAHIEYTLRVLNIKPYFACDPPQNERDHGILVGLMKAADELEKQKIRVVMRRPGRTMYQTGQPLKAQILEEERARKEHTP